MAYTESTGLDRRDFIGGAFLTTAGAVTAGISRYQWGKREPEAVQDVSQRENNPVRLGFIGVGRRGGALLRSGVLVPGNEVVAVCDIQRAAQNAAEKNVQGEYSKKNRTAKIQRYDDYRRLLDDKSVEAVFIATPQYLHGPMALDALEAGKHVYCEKAMALTIGENRDIVRMVNAREDQVFQVGHQRHYSPLYRKIVEMVHSDQIGNVAGFRAQWNRNDMVRRPAEKPELEKVINWRLYKELSGGLTTEFASHQIDVCNWTLGTHPDSVCGFGGIDWYQDGRDTEDNIHLIFNYRVPVVKRDPYGRPMTVNGKAQKDDPKASLAYETKDGEVVRRDVRFTYNSIMQNAHLGPSEMIFGQYGTLEVSLQGAEFFKEKKARVDPNRVAEGTNPRRSLQKRILTTGTSVDPTTAGLTRKKGKPVVGETREDERWVENAGDVAGAYDKHETMLAIDGFLQRIREVRSGDTSKRNDVQNNANVVWGLWGAVPALMANIAMRDQRIVRWDEFFPEERDAPQFIDNTGVLRTT